MKKFFSLFIAALFSVAMFAEEQNTYTVAGDSEPLFGTPTWDATKTENDMTLENNVYVWEKKNVALEAGDIQYKIVLNHEWDDKKGGGCWPANNKIYTIPAKDNYNVKVIFHWDTHAVEMQANKVEEQGGEDPEPGTPDPEELNIEYFLVGDFTDPAWTALQDYKLTPNTGFEGEFTLQTELKEGAQLKVLGLQDEEKTWFPKSQGTHYTVPANLAGNVTVYFRPAGNAEWESFHQGGFFYIEKETEQGGEENPDPETPEVYGDFFLIGSFNSWKEADANFKFAATETEGEYKLIATLAENDELKVYENGENAKYYPNGTDNNYVVPADLAGNVAVYFRPAGNKEWETFHQGGFFFIEKTEEQPDPQPENPEVYGDFFLIGSFNGWKEADDKFKFQATETEGEYMLVTELAENDELKVYENGENAKYYPNGTDNNYVVPAELAGNAAIYFRPAGNKEWESFHQGGFFYIELTETPPTPEPSKYEGKFYITGESLVGSWEPNALLVEAQSKKFEALKAGKYGFKVTLDGTWETAKGYSDLTEEIKGVWEGESNNICFALAEDGDVTVTYFEQEGAVTFKLEGKFDESQAPELPTDEEYYLIGSFNGWKEADANYKFAATDVEGEYKIEVTLAEGAALKVFGYKDGKKQYFPDGMGNDYAVPAELAGKVNVYFRPAGNEEWVEFHEGGFFYIEKVGGEDPDPQPSNMEYFLVGSFNNWVVGDISYKFYPNGDAEGEYMQTVDLKSGWKLKIVGVEGENQQWFPEGEGNDFEVTKQTAGNVKFYFRPAGNAEWETLHQGGFFYIEVVTPEPDDQAIDNTVVDGSIIKTFENGQMIIIKNGVKYTVHGAIVR